MTLHPPRRYGSVLSGCLVVAAVMAAAPRGSLAARPPSSAPVWNGKLYGAGAGAFAVSVIDEDWHDPARKRDVPVRIYLPRAGQKNDAHNGQTEKSAGHADKTAGAGERKLPVIVFSHGLWASRTTYGYFGHHLASHGYVVIAPTHIGSDTADLRDRMLGGGRQTPRARLRERRRDRAADNSQERLEEDQPGSDDSQRGADADPTGDDRSGRGGLPMQRVNEPDNLRNRPRDISFVIDQIAKEKTLSSIADMSRIGVAGHSFAAYTAMAIGGMTIDLPDAKHQSFRDKRVRAGLPMSPEGTGTMGITKDSWDHFAVPVLFLTGTKDYGAGRRAASWRRTGFEAIHGVDDYLVTLEDATHFTFAATGGSGQARHTALIESLATAFFDAYVREDAQAKHWLREYFSAAKHEECAAEFRAAK